MDSQTTPQFDAASRREFGKVLPWSLDRFSREGALETTQHLQRLNSFGVDWKSYSEQYLDSCSIFKDAVLWILATTAKQERVRLSERTLAGLERARAQGKQLGRPCKIVPRDRIRELHAHGLGCGAIAKKVGGMSFMTVHRILRRQAA